VSILDITQADHYIWQRRAAAALVRLLDKHRDLPPIVWRVGTGANLVGQINGLQPATTARAEFEAWTDALKLDQHRECGDAVTYLVARTRRDGVTLAILADLIHDDEQARA
jgi:hypothetical protein